ncbi:MAG TPA: restriction endonuclease subunit S [Pseudonocardiaceae bacterium]
MSDWKRTTIGDVLTLQRGFDITRASQRPGNVPVVSSGGIGSYHDTAAVEGPGVVIGRKGTLGNVFYLDHPYWPHDTTLWVKDFKGSFPRFVYYFFKQLDVSGLDVGSANPTLNRNHVHPIMILWPSRPEQQAIAAMLGALDDKISVNELIARIGQELAGAYLVSMLSPVQDVPLADIADITMGSSPPGDTYNDSGLGLPFYQGTKNFGSWFPSRRVWCSQPVRIARSDETLLSVRAPVGRVNRAWEECCIGRGLAALSTKTGTPSVLFHLLLELPDRWLPYESEGTVFGAVNKNQISTVMVPSTSGDKAQRLEDLLRPLDERVMRVFVENETLAELRDTLLPKLMSGQLRIKDAERLVEDAV